jgi:hypothetical protein
MQLAIDQGIEALCTAPFRPTIVVGPPAPTKSWLDDMTSFDLVLHHFTSAGSESTIDNVKLYGALDRYDPYTLRHVDITTYDV